MTSQKPPFRADQVGSLLRPQYLKEARVKRDRGELSPQNIRAVEDRAIRELVAKEEGVGLKGITDGELRRSFWHLDFLSQLGGVITKANPGLKFQATEEQPPVAAVTGKVRCARPIMIDDFAFLKSVVKQTPKFTIPSPAMLHLRGGRTAISTEVYPDLEEFWADTSKAYREAIGHLVSAGCTYLQIDDVSFSYLCDEKFRAGCRQNGDDPDKLAHVYSQAINQALAGRPAGLGVTMHTCRGNFKSTWVASGGYEAVAEAIFSTDVDGFFMEFDTERAGSFEPLRFLPKNKKVVLGLVTSKQPELESKDMLKRRIDEAARYAPLENLCLSPQCGFSSTHHGNLLSEDDQWRKLALIVEVAGEVWGSVDGR
jgi:5-methyltetrahydropteroyltriglutamate--homocysteine methyltransferase